MEEIRNKLKKVIKDLFDLDIEPVVSVAPENTGADYASNVAMQLARQVRLAPRQIAEKIAAEFSDCEIAGPGFLNFILPNEYFLNKIESFSGKIEENISQDEYSGKTVICEFSDPNPFKVLHVGHLYTSIVGDSISRLFELSGGKVVRANFGGDVGLHVAKTLWAMTAQSTSSSSSEDALLSRRISNTASFATPSFSNLMHSEQSSTQTEQTIETNDFTIEDIAKCYVEGTRAYEEDEKAHEEIVQLNKQIYEIAAKDLHDSRLAEMYWKGRELSYQYFEDFYAKIGVKFDKYYPESTVAGRGLEEVRNGLSRGVYEMSDGAVVYRGEKVGLHTRVFINQNGLPTYEAKDVGLIYTKFDDYHFDKSVVITGNDIIDYMKVVLSSISEMNPELTERTTHLTHGQVKLPGNEKMSSRKGNFIKAVDILNAVIEKCDNNQKIAMAAIKYAFLKYKVGGDIEFNIDESVSTTGNSGVYLLYSAVRSKKIIEKCTKNEAGENFELNLFEKNLVKKMIQYREALSEATKEMAPHKICNYLYELAQEFSRFYENVKVAGSEFEQERKKIVQSYLNIMEHGLNLLGIEVPEEM